MEGGRDGDMGRINGGREGWGYGGKKWEGGMNDGGREGGREGLEGGREGGIIHCCC